MANVINKAFRYGTPADAIGNPEDEPADVVEDPQTVISLLKKLILVGSLEAAAALGHRVLTLEQQMEALTQRVELLEAEATSDDTWQSGIESNIAGLDNRVDILEGERGSDVTLRFEYTLDSGIIAPPSATQLRLNNLSQPSATLLWFHNNDADNAGQQNFLKLITKGTTCLIQQKTDAAAWQQYAVADNAFNATSYFQVPILWLAGGTVIPTGQRVIIFIYRGY